MSRLRLPANERKILEILWKHGPITSPEIERFFYVNYPDKGRSIRYQSIMTFLARLEKKVLINRDCRTRKHVFSAAVTQDDIKHKMFLSAAKELANEFCDGNMQDMVNMILVGKNYKEKPDDSEE